MYRRAEGCQRRVVAALVLALFVGAIQLYSATARACSCMQQSPAEAYEQAVSVFEGHVLEITRPEASADQPAPDLRVRLSVVRSWKGMEQEQVVLTTASDSAGCGYPFAADGDYLVYASATATGLSASLCSRTAQVSEAGEDMRVLGMGVTPVEPRAPKAEQDALAKPKTELPARGGCASCAVHASATFASRALAFASSAACALVLLFRRRRRSASRS